MKLLLYFSTSVFALLFVWQCLWSCRCFANIVDNDLGVTHLEREYIFSDNELDYYLNNDVDNNLDNKLSNEVDACNSQIFDSDSDSDSDSETSIENERPKDYLNGNCVGTLDKHRKQGSFLLDVSKSSMYFFDTYVFDKTGANELDEKECLHQCLLSDDDQCWTRELQNCVDECTLIDQPFCNPREYCRNIVNNMENILECIDDLIEDCGNQCVSKFKDNTDTEEHLNFRGGQIESQVLRTKKINGHRSGDNIDTDDFEANETTKDDVGKNVGNDNQGNLRRRRFQLKRVIQNGLKSTSVYDLLVCLGVIVLFLVVSIIFIVERIQILEDQKYFALRTARNSVSSDKFFRSHNSAFDKKVK